MSIREIRLAVFPDQMMMKLCLIISFLAFGYGKALTINPKYTKTTEIPTDDSNRISLSELVQITPTESGETSDQAGEKRLIVGDWVAQWDDTYGTWFYYNSRTGGVAGTWLDFFLFLTDNLEKSTWEQPREMAHIVFRDPKQEGCADIQIKLITFNQFNFRDQKEGTKKRANCQTKICRQSAKCRLSQVSVH